MEVVSSDDGILTNIEVLELIREQRANNPRKSLNDFQLQGRNYVHVKAIEYLENTPAGGYDTARAMSCIAQLKALQLGFSEQELTQLANLAPTSEVEIYLMVANCGERLDDLQTERVIQIIQRTLLLPDNPPLPDTPATESGSGVSSAVQQQQ